VGATAEGIRRPSELTAARRALWPALVLVALAGFLADILLRRIRIFETA
jgi:hypothetical protein